MSGRYGGGYQSGLAPPGSLGQGLSTLRASGRSVAILLPMTGPRADLGRVLLQAAQLAIADSNAPALDVLDTAGTASGAATAAQSAVGNGDSFILGPLTSAETTSVAPVAQAAGVPVLAFTNDSSQSKPGVRWSSASDRFRPGHGQRS